MLRTLYRHLLLPGFEGGLKRRHTFFYWRALERSQWYSPAMIEQLQFDRLRALVEYAFLHCPYYRRRWQERGLYPERLTSLADWQRWPLLPREEVVAHRGQMRSTMPGVRLLSKSTGGSSGMPLHFDLDAESNERRTAAAYRGYEWAGAGPGAKQLFLWGVPLGQRSRLKRIKDSLWDVLQRRRVLNSFALSEATVEPFFKTLNRDRPDAIVAYTNPLYSFACMLAERGLRPWSPKGIVVGAEKLYPFQREKIEAVFAAPVFETYGSREVMLMGAECERHSGLHLTAENLLVEVIADDGRPTPAGEEGQVVVTDLTNRGMPFLRYVNGDRAVAGFTACPCGRGLPMLRRVVGRQLDVVHTPDGRRVPGEYFPHLMKDYAPVRRFQVVQERADRVQVRLVVTSSWEDGHRVSLEQQLRATLGPAMGVQIAYVEDIPLTAAGKLRVVVNLT